MKKLCIEISYTWDDSSLPEHEGYYDSIDAARKALDDLEELFKSPRFQRELDAEIAEREKLNEEINDQMKEINKNLGEILEDLKGIFEKDE